jgi:hypothetical protein
MKYLLLLFLSATVYAQSSNYALVNADGTVIEVFVATPDVAANYPQVAKQAFPDAVACYPALGAGMGWHYDSRTNTFTAPLPEVTLNVAKAQPLFTLQDPTPVTYTTNNVATPVVTTNNISILTTNNSQ